jgi:D-sedoheptulose 7-phosphate isomerase
MTSNDRLHDRMMSLLKKSAEVQLRAAESCGREILEAAMVLSDCFREGGKLLLCGNGGSAADCQHMAAELVSRLSADFERPGMPAIALTTDSSFMTAYANDYGYEGVFERQVQVLGKPGDVLIAISTSGSSENVIRAVLQAREIGLKTIGLIGQGGRLASLCDVAIAVPDTSTQHVQETHLAIEHVLCELVEIQLFGRA